MDTNRSNSKTGVIILNFNNFEDTINCIESVERYNTAPIKYIIIDNASTRFAASEKLGIYLREHFNDNCLFLDDDSYKNKIRKNVLPYVTYFQSSTNDGYAKGNNKGLLLAESDNEIANILILNNDVLFVQDIIPSLIERYIKLHDVGILSTILYKSNLQDIDLNCARNNETVIQNLIENFFHYPLRLFRMKNPFMHQFILENNRKDLPLVIPIDLPSGSCMFINKDLFREIGYFDPNTFLYYEENILFKKLSSLGKHNYLLTDVKCIHLGAQSTSTTPSYFSLKCYFQSCCYYMKHYHKTSLLSYYLLILSMIFSYMMIVIRNWMRNIYR